MELLPKGLYWAELTGLQLVESRCHFDRALLRARLELVSETVHRGRRLVLILPVPLREGDPRALATARALGLDPADLDGLTPLRLGDWAGHPALGTRAMADVDEREWDGRWFNHVRGAVRPEDL